MAMQTTHDTSNKSLDISSPPSVNEQPQIDINNSCSTDEEAKTQRSFQCICSFAVIYTLLFFNGCCFTAVAPSVPFYLEYLEAPPEFLGWVVSSYSLGQILGSPLAGRWNDHCSSKRLLIISAWVGLLSSILYSLAPGYHYLLMSRLITGISAGFELTTELTFIANHTTMKERTAFMASVTACNVVGFIVGPNLSSVLAMLNIKFLGLEIDQYTGPGWLLAAMFLISLVLLELVFTDEDPYYKATDKKKELSSTSTNSDNKSVAELLDDHHHHNNNNRTEKLLSSEKSDDATMDLEPRGGCRDVVDGYCAFEDEDSMIKNNDPPPHPSLLLVMILIFVQFSIMCGFSLLETITSPLVEEEFGWTVRDCNILLACGGAFSLTVYGTFLALSKRLQDRQLVLAALVLCTLGFLLAVDWNSLGWMPIEPLLPYKIRFLVGFNLIYGGFITGRPIVIALYSKLIDQHHQGQYLGWMVAGGSAARTLGPFYAVYFYYEIDGSGNNLVSLFGSVGLFHIVCILLLIYQWPHLLPKDPQRNETVLID